jgi:hypothetical protein
VLRTSTTAPPTGGTWNSPALLSITKNGNNYLAIDRYGFIYNSANLTTWVQESNPRGYLIHFYK